MRKLQYTLTAAILFLSTSTALVAPKTSAEVRALLAKEVKFPGIDDPKTTLGDVLKGFTKQYGVKLVVEEAAFKAENINNVLRTEVARRRPLAPMNTQFDQILRRVLRRIPEGPLEGDIWSVYRDFAVFQVRRDTILITTRSALDAARLRPEPPPRPTAAMLRRAKDLKGRLNKQTNFRGLDGPRMTLNEALELVAKQYDLTFDVNERAFKFDNLTDVLKTEICNPPIPAMEKVPLAKVIEAILARIPAPSKAAYRLTPQGDIEISTTIFLRAAAEKRGGK